MVGRVQRRRQRRFGKLEKKVKELIMKVKKKIRLWKTGRKEWHSKEWKKKMELRRRLYHRS